MNPGASATDTNSRTYSIRGTGFSAARLPAGLYLVSTPIGNLADITLRALETLAGCDVIACEDTRTSGVLLKHFGIDRPKTSYTEHNAASRGPQLLSRISEGQAVALISDAGTPLVSDPGFRLVESAIDAGLTVVPIPGASAPLAALVGSGLNLENFRFGGFLPGRTQARLDRLQDFANETSTLIFFDSPNRLVSSLAAIGETFGPDRDVVVARELTKMHETFYRGTASDLQQTFAGMEKIRGEIVVLVAGAQEKPASENEVTGLLVEALQDMKTKDAAAHVAQLTGKPRNELYRQALALKDRTGGDG